jgi:hypothetical protein
MSSRKRNPPGTVSGYVFIDLNQSGTRDPGEPGIAGVDVTVSGTAFPNTRLERPLPAADVGGGSLVVQTDADGLWRFPRLSPGEYEFVETQPPAFIDGLEENAEVLQPPFDVLLPPVTVGNDIFSNVWLYPDTQGPVAPVAPAPVPRNGPTPLADLPFLDRGLYNFGEIGLATLSGSVYVDKNNDGIRDPGEAGIPGVTVWLMGTDLAGNPVAEMVQTDGNGDVRFEDVLPGLYDLIEIHPTEFLDGKAGPSGEGGLGREDVNGDGIITPRDALMVINHLNGFTAPIAGEGEFPVTGEGEYYESWDAAQPVESSPAPVDAHASQIVPDVSFRASDSAPVHELDLLDTAEESSYEDELLGDVLDDLARDVAGQWSGIM